MSLETQIAVAIGSFAFAEVILLSTILVKNHLDSVIVRYGLLTNVWILSYLLPTSLLGDTILGLNLSFIHIVRDAGPIAGWLLSGSIYIANFRPSVGQLLFVALLCAASFIGNSSIAAFPEVILDGASAITLVTQLGFGIYTIRLIQVNSGDDLVQERRMIRLVVTSSMALAIFSAMIFGVLQKQMLVQAWMEMGTTGFISVMLFIAITKTFYMDSRQSFMPTRADVRDLAPLSHHLTASRLKNSELVAHLDRLMNDEHIYLQPGLTVRKLAERLGITEHRLRDLINGDLQYRNFSTFLNRFRIRSACDQLQDVQLARIPILTIAMDLGFRSAGPFSRAFKAEIGKTPSEYRKDSMAVESREIIVDNSPI